MEKHGRGRGEQYSNQDPAYQAHKGKHIQGPGNPGFKQRGQIQESGAGQWSDEGPHQKAKTDERGDNLGFNKDVEEGYRDMSTRPGGFEKKEQEFPKDTDIPDKIREIGS